MFCTQRYKYCPQELDAMVHMKNDKKDKSCVPKDINSVPYTGHFMYLLDAMVRIRSDEKVHVLYSKI